MKFSFNRSLCLLAILFTTSASGNDKLLYAYHLEFRSMYNNQNTPKQYETRLYELDPITKNSRQIFSDFNTGIILASYCGTPGQPQKFAVGGGRVFGVGVERTERSLRFLDCPREDVSVFEIATDGTNRLRKVGKLLGSGPSGGRFFSTQNGDKLGYVSYENNKSMFFIHETKSGKLLFKYPVPYAADEQCLLGERVGWLANGKYLYFDLDDGVEDAHCSERGSYFDER